MYLIIGLGNPGEKYAHTYHNLGFTAAEATARLFSARFERVDCRAELAECKAGRNKVIIARPLTFMNASGEAVCGLLRKYKVSQENMLIMYDDVDLPRGTLRLRGNGSAGTHNGMRNIIETLGDGNFPRLRIGAGRPPADVPLIDYVLSRIDGDAAAEIDPAVARAAEAAKAFAYNVPFDKIMQELNGRHNLYERMNNSNG
jgi:PTH1 family peptidyl-tRNA hydrolase